MILHQRVRGSVIAVRAVRAVRNTHMLLTETRYVADASTGRQSGREKLAWDISRYRYKGHGLCKAWGIRRNRGNGDGLSEGTVHKDRGIAAMDGGMWSICSKHCRVDRHHPIIQCNAHCSFPRSCSLTSLPSFHSSTLNVRFLMHSCRALIDPHILCSSSHTLTEPS